MNGNGYAPEGNMADGRAGAARTGHARKQAERIGVDTGRVAARGGADPGRGVGTPDGREPHRPIVTIGLLDNDQFALAFLERSLGELMPESRVLWRTTSGRDAVARCLDPDRAPNVLLTDMSMDELSGPAVCRAVRTRSARVAILAVTSFSLAVYASKAADAGAQGIVPKSVESPIIDAVRAVARGATWDSGTGVAFQNAADAHARLGGGRTPRQFLLSDREAEAMNLCSRGLTTEQIAADMRVGVSTAKTYLTRAVHKLGVSSRGQAVALWTGASEGER